MFTALRIYSIIPGGSSWRFHFFRGKGLLSGPHPYLKHFQLSRVPFRQQPDPEIFFPGGSRESVLQDLCADILDGKPLLKLIGNEGTGKSLLYLLLARKLDIKKFQLACLDRPAGSFDEVLRQVLAALGRPSNEEGSGQAERNVCLPALLARLRELKEAGKKTALLIDAAEQLFPATLERLVRVIAEIREEGLLPVLLVGRPELERNLQQLSSYCRFADMQRGYMLSPFEFSETESYIRFRLQEVGSSKEKAGNIFSGEAVSALYFAARGNLGLLHLLAEQALVAAYEAGMFRVDEELITRPQEESRKTTSILARYSAALPSSRLPLLAGLLLALVLLWLAVRPDENKITSLPVPELVAVPQDKPGPLLEAITSGAPSTLSSGQQPPAAATHPAPPQQETENSGVPVLETSAPSAKGEKKGEAFSPPSTPDTGTGGQLPERAAPALAGSPPDRIAAGNSLGEASPVLSPPLPPEKAPGQGSAPPLEPESDHPAVSAPLRETKLVELQAQGRKKRINPGSPPANMPTAGSGKEQQTVFAERMRASDRWRSRPGYTIQLMVLASAEAEENFKGLLAREQYAAIKDQLYLVRKTVPPTLYIYYGSYPSMEEARQGRDRLPDFLRKNQPYPLPIAQAVKKGKE